MESKYIFFLAIVLLLFSCKTEKQIAKNESHEKTDSIVNRDIQVNESLLETNESSSEYQELQQIIDNSNTESIITVFSKPDSAGSQYVERQIVVNKQANVHKFNKAKVSNSDITSTEIKRDSSDNTVVRLKKEIDRVSKTSEKAKFPVWLIVVGITFVIVAAGVVFLKIKKLI